MNILVEAIQFHHDPEHARTSALPLARNATEGIVTPEWRRAVCQGPEDSLAAYSLTGPTGRAIVIKAQFRRMLSNMDAVEVRAIDPTGRIPRWLMPVLRRAGITLPPGNILGKVDARVVRFGTDGMSALESFTLRNTRIQELGVGVWTNTWQWQYRLSPVHRWVNIDQTEHRVYVLVDLPKEPWGTHADPDDTVFLPWTDLLEYSCRWAQGAKTLDEAASGITRGLYNLGPSVIFYDYENAGVGYGMINMTAFLERLRGGIGLGPYVNCQDCARFVVVMANLIGCELWTADIFMHGMLLNPIVAIGCTSWDLRWPSFGGHMVAWKGEQWPENFIYDACLQVDGDADPTAADPHHTPLLPLRMAFGVPGSGEYLDRLATPQTRDLCEFDPGTAVRPRPYQLPRPIENDQRSQLLRQRFMVENWHGRTTLTDGLLLWRFHVTGDELPGWRLLKVIAGPSESDVRLETSLWKPTQENGDHVLRLEVTECVSRPAAHDHLLRLLGQMESPLLAEKVTPLAGDVAFGEDHNRMLLFARGNVVVRLTNAGRDMISVTAAATAIDKLLAEQPANVLETATVAAVAPPDSDVWLKLIARHGEVALEGDRPVLTPRPTETAALDVFIYRTGQSVTRQRVETPR